jgi:hypothetical protein
MVISFSLDSFCRSENKLTKEKINSHNYNNFIQKKQIKNFDLNFLFCKNREWGIENGKLYFLENKKIIDFLIYIFILQ